MHNFNVLIFANGVFCSKTMMTAKYHKLPDVKGSRQTVEDLFFTVYVACEHFPNVFVIDVR